MIVRFLVSLVALLMMAVMGLGLSSCSTTDLRPSIPLAEIHGKSSPDAAMFVAKQAPLMVSVLVRPDELAAIDAQLVAQGRSPLSAEQLTQAWLADTGLSYGRDIQPWVGDEVTLAVTTADLDRNLDNGEQPGYLLALSSTDLQRSEQFVQKLWRNQAIAGSDLVFERYAGVTITTHAPSDPDQAPTLASVTVDSFVLLANHPKVLQQALNTVQVTNLSLAQDRRYQEALAHGGDRLAVVFVNVPQLLDWLVPSADPAPFPLLTSLLAGVRSTAGGLVVEGSLFSAAGQHMPLSQPLLSAPVGALQYIPRQSALVAAGVDLFSSWQQLNAGLAGYRLPQQWLASLVSDRQTQWGIDLPQDILSHLVGEYAIALLPTTPAFSDWVLVTQSSPELAEVLQNLDVVATEQGVSLGRFNLDGQTIATWATLKPVTEPQLQLAAQVQGVYTSLGNYTVVASSLRAMQAALAAPTQSFLGDATFQRAIAPFHTPNDGYLYLNWSQLRGAIAQKIPLLSFITSPKTPLVTDVDEITFTSYGNDSTAHRGEIFLHVGR
ncbi:MAG TPA: DUF3352 domain-containing protein [Candidatus Obscuribacterales bacterium]